MKSELKLKVLAVMVAAGMVAAGMVRGAEAGYKFPGWDCRDVEVLQAQLALAETDPQKVSMTYLIALTGHTPASYVEACEMIDTAITAVDPAIGDNYRREYKKQYIFKLHKHWMSELLSWSQANPSAYDMYICFSQAGSEWAWQRVAECLQLYKYPPSAVLLGIDYLNRQAIALGKDDAEVLGLLKKLNRVFSALLTTDQAAWETVVAQVRTLMETYQ